MDSHVSSYNSHRWMDFEAFMKRLLVGGDSERYVFCIDMLLHFVLRTTTRIIFALLIKCRVDGRGTMEGHNDQFTKATAAKALAKF